MSVAIDAQASELFVPSKHRVLLDEAALRVITQTLPEGEPLRVDQAADGRPLVIWDQAQATAAQVRDALVVAGGDPDQAAHALASPCRAFDWCMVRGGHREHSSETIDIFPTAGDAAYLAAYLVDLGCGPFAVVQLGTWVHLDAAGLRAEVARIRQHCDLLEALADQLAHIEAAGGGHDGAAAA